MGFDKNFFWGGSIAANQYEGSWNIDGRGMTKSDVLTSGSVNSSRKITFRKNDGTFGWMEEDDSLPEGCEYAVAPGQFYPNHDAVKGYEHIEDDIALFAEMGFSMFRLSISWARLFPTGIEDSPNEDGIRYYHKVFSACKKNGIEPLVTLLHFDTPLHLIKNGGWLKRDILPYFHRFVETCFKEYRDEVKYWITINEINTAVCFLPDEAPDSQWKDALVTLHHQFLASADAVITGHKINSNNLIGCMIAGETAYPYSCNPKDILLNRHKWEEKIFYCGDVHCFGEYSPFAERIWEKHNVHIEITQDDKKILKDGTMDMYTFSYYYSTVVTASQTAKKIEGDHVSGIMNPYLEYSKWNWAIDPMGLQYYLETIFDRYRKPVMIVENGLGEIEELEDGCIHDSYRIKYLGTHIQSTKKAVENGVNLLGYLMWSPIDIVSAGTGEMRKRYGLIYVDADDAGNGTFSRTKKDSFDWYKKVIESNGERLGCK